MRAKRGYLSPALTPKEIYSIDRPLPVPPALVAKDRIYGPRRLKRVADLAKLDYNGHQGAE
ncbi:hypothetical protein [Candidatus Methylomirabilis sp.]|uniref:hypothetical protein n=1 Tax=Candidatus Methylomirabilis sp. TaxID=2032687 RepID=UPI003C790E30